ncbi:hypothetical protein OGAPHI_004085 [Ogataea philodendri]|uniref:Calcium permeable stress-gated cation channel 1 n=1 Tax=Ogataea philodendri TaxID=1378263 RepID=A0A9P8T4M7_9ASCO|nr:uncharacterized protein OGAPHI_004085 [Ogataea philodendri]KAH3665896.1 hypothetical protein OGAPHI_004085 [Ogataea philodendri]
MPPPLPSKSLFGWLPIVWRITEAEVLEYAGLDAFVFLGFFKMSIKLLSICWLFSSIIISPIRYYFTGDYDQGDGNDKTASDSPSEATDYYTYLWVYVIFTYIFTFVTKHFLMQQTRKVIECRQKVLGSQKSVTDRTIRLSGIPPELRNERALRDTIESLGIGKVSKIVICREWKKLDTLFHQRDRIIRSLEIYWAQYIGTTKNPTFNIRPYAESSYPLTRDSHRYRDDDEEAADESISTENDISESDILDYEYTSNTAVEYDADSSTDSNPFGTFGSAVYKKRPQIKLGFKGLWGKSVDAIDYYTQQLKVIDEEILAARQRHYPATPTAFITMDSVATAQTVAQAVLDPRVSFLITRLAPAPKDIIWENVTLPRKDRVLKIYYITIITGIVGVAFIFPVGYLATLLNLKTISKFWPDLGDLLEKHEWAQRFVTELLPVYIFTFLNFVIPLLYVWLSSRQGFISHGEEELSVVSKNFFYVFVNLFLVFTMAGTASNYWGYLSDSKKLALQLATSLKGLSTFYVDTILLQGLALMPCKLLVLGHIMRFVLIKAKCKTPRDYRELYRPPLFNFGLHLPHPLLILIITLLYSVMSTKILSSGLAYFVVGYFVYKYLLIYTCIHPQHSTGQVMPIIFRRVVLGLLLFQLTVAGSLALNNAYILAMCLIPLPFLTILYSWNFERNYLPLSFYIALRAIDKEPTVEPNSQISSGNLSGHVLANGVSLSSLRSSTIDERREFNQTYEYPHLVQSLDGPWLAVNSEQVVMATADGTIRKRFTLEEY